MRPWATILVIEVQGLPIDRLPGYGAGWQERWNWRACWKPGWSMNQRRNTPESTMYASATRLRVPDPIEFFVGAGHARGCGVSG